MDKQTDKLWKKTIRDQQKRIKPGECQKYIRLVVDSHILSAPYGREFIAELNRATGELKYDIRTLPIKESIIWERSMGQLALKPNEVNALSEVWQKEDQVVKILTQPELVQMINSSTLHTLAESFKKHYEKKQHIVLFLRSSEKQSTAISTALIELQILHQLKVLQVQPSIRELLLQLKRLTKSIAEVPYKKQKSEILSTFKKFLANDKKQCVRVEGTNGFGRLWQQHLNRLPLVTLEVAETIIDKYSCPKKLLDDLKNNADAVKEISDLKIKRSGPVAMQTDRRIGNVLSYKLYMLYNSKDPNTLI
ncbi:crossover junction endonuclease EME1 [Lucilia sericata]|uniref:crossover junction endonuclease EME1 n=1 Tax=Lucilia sericata TaxID=13632 RepID=UPI0018A8086E|nr:crossover junction endonuclease EME1 [Lucilia sericata]XP_037810833.1 crossover junction endonuclease EME1 [Lucilia sericata]